MTSATDTLLGDCPTFLSTLRSAAITAATDVNVLITGESGTGKELLAKQIHQQSRRADKPLITINCAALPESLAESELFGHRKGAFTSASQDQLGRVQAAAGGTLFLDEIAELSLSLQAKLLRFLETRECQPIGQARTDCVDVRIIAATNRNLQQEVEHKRFREDLYYRLNVVPLQLPPLRERGRDIEILTNRLTARLAIQHCLDTPRYSVRAMELLKQYAWPGNVRELRNVCERMLILFAGQTIDPENLPAEFRRTQSTQLGGNFLLPENGLQLEQLESSMIRQALDKAHGNQSKAARLLGLSRGTLIYRMKKFALN